jgi:2,3-bisphosphoglycerate-independent phosphoglycerate mutase
MISAVDLLGKVAGMDVKYVEGTTGYIDTNFVGEANAALDFLKGDDKTPGGDLAYIHIEAPDECGHRGEAANKVKAIERIDRLVLGTILKAHAAGDLDVVSTQKDEQGKTVEIREEVRLKILIAPDHATPLSLKTHTSEPVPFLIYDSGLAKKSGVRVFDEDSAKKAGIFLEEGHELMERFVGE